MDKQQTLIRKIKNFFSKPVAPVLPLGAVPPVSNYKARELAALEMEQAAKSFLIKPDSYVWHKTDIGIKAQKPSLTIAELFKSSRRGNYTSRTITILTREGVESVDQLTGLKPYELLCMDDLGRGTLNYIKETLGKHGLKLKQSPCE